MIKIFPTGKKFVFGCFLTSFFLFIQVVSAQKNPHQEWNEGFILLLDETEYSGKIRFDLQNNTVQVAFQGKMLSFGAAKVEYFEFFDAEKKTNRIFYSLPFAQKNTYEALIFFELMVEGKLTLLNREKLVEKIVSRPFTFGFPGTSYVEYYWVDEFYLLDENGKVKSFDPEKENVFDQFSASTPDVRLFIEANKNAVRDRYELMRVITEYNKFFKQE
jgi:hypothetical protein